MSDKTIVVNVKKELYDVYCGRPTIYRNPYRIGVDGDRETVIKKFEVRFHNKMKNDPAYRKAILGLRGKRIGCFCYPLPCHLDIIANFLNSL
jgi:hypothetical protein